jgi:hypothetical protein
MPGVCCVADAVVAKDPDWGRLIKHRIAEGQRPEEIEKTILRILCSCTFSHSLDHNPSQVGFLYLIPNFLRIKEGRTAVPNSGRWQRLPLLHYCPQLQTAL